MVEVPSERARTRRIALAVVAGIVGSLLVGGGLWAALRPKDNRPRQTTIEPAEETSAQPLPSVPGSSPATSGSEPTSAPDGSLAPVPAALARVAFVLGNRIYVADQDGTDATPVSPKAENYALSPDGTKLAVVVLEPDAVPGVASGGAVAIIDVASQAVVEAGAGAVSDTPAWSPDSSWLVYTARSGDRLSLRRVNADGSSDAKVTEPGVGAVVSADGKRVAYSRSSRIGLGGALSVVDLASGTSSPVSQGADASAWGWGPAGDLYFTRAVSSGGSSGLWRARAREAGSEQIGSIVLQPPAFVLHDVLVSGDGAFVLVSAQGDDEYSRLHVFDTAGRSFRAISTRRDAYPCCWGPENRIVYFEGNVYQGEPSVLASIDANGMARRLAVTGAER